MAAVREVVVRDLQELIAVLTQDDWQPSESKYRMNIAYRGLSTADYELETGLARLQDRSTAALEENLAAELQEVCPPRRTEILQAAAGTLARFDEDTKGSAAAPLFFEPPSLDDRIINQSAVFSIMTSADESLARWFEKHPEVCRKVVIPARLKWAIRNHLDQANVTDRVLFPGLDGLCRWLTRYYGDRPEKVYPDARISPSEPSVADLDKAAEARDR